ncbi:MAG: phosphatase PAP2 family protein [Sedimentisphaerales bacterium]
MMIHKKLISKFNFCGKDVFFLVLIVVCGLLSIWSYFKLDQQVFSWLCQKPPGWGENFFEETIAYLGKTWLPVWLLLVWFIATGKQRPVLVALLALIIVLLIVTPLKVSVGRPRPREVKVGQIVEKPHNLRGYASFPSGDTASVFAVATAVIFFVSWRWAPLLLSACTAVGLLRVTAMAHYPSDVFAAAAIGSFAGWLALQIDKKWSLLKPPRFNLTRGIAMLAIIIIPLVLELSKGFDKLSIFFEVYVPLAVFIFLAAKRDSGK